MVREYSRRTAICLLGLALCSFSNVISVKAGVVGTNAWNTLFMGISGISGLSFGGAALLVNCFVVATDIAGKGKIGFGSVLNAFLIPYFSDLFLAVFDFLPAAPNQIWGMAYTLFAQLWLSFAVIIYMRPALGCGPRDTLMVIVGKKMPRAPIGLAKLAVEVAVLAIGTILGAPFGLGSVMVLLLQASMFQFACFVFRYEPRNAQHENIMDTIRRIQKKH